MTEEWGSTLDQKLVVGVVFFDFREAFNSLPHYSLLYNFWELQVTYGAGEEITSRIAIKLLCKRLQIIIYASYCQVREYLKDEVNFSISISIYYYFFNLLLE